MKKLAICYTTRNNPDAVDELLSTTKDYYLTSDVDVYIFDSSESDETKKVCDRHVEEGFINLFYVLLSKDSNLADKMEAILSCQYFEDKYLYVWPIKDRAYFDGDSVNQILEKIDLNPEMIFLVPCIPIRKNYSNPGLFYQENGTFITSLETSIFQVQGLMARTQDDILGPIRNNRYLSWWAPYYYTLQYIAQLNNPIIEVLGEDRVCFNTTNGAAMSWRKNIIEIGVLAWIQINELLPNCYQKYKDDVIKRFGSLWEINCYWSDWICWKSFARRAYSKWC